MNSYLLTHNEAACYGCRSCEQICPQKAIIMKPNEEGFFYPLLDESVCIKCGLCAKACPYDNTVMASKQPLKVFAAQNKNNNALKNSSSGGIFSAIADYVLGSGGAVAGCVFDDDFKAIHVVTEEPAIVEKMRGSKYVQSDTQNSYTEIRKRLERGQLVFFSGTPCQVDGLKKYLGKDYENLITVDLICHGVPSPALFAEYLNDIEHRKGKITDIRFRNKVRNGWCSQGSITYLKGNTEKTYTISPYNASYYYYYLANNVNRMSCYLCKYSTTQRVGDISIGDYWNIQDVQPDINSNGGISLILVNSERGQELVKSLADKVSLHETQLAPAVKGNGNLLKPCDLPESRKDIYRRIKEHGYAMVAKKDCKYQYVIPFFRKHTPHSVKEFLKKMLH